MLRIRTMRRKKLLSILTNCRLQIGLCSSVRTVKSRPIGGSTEFKNSKIQKLETNIDTARRARIDEVHLIDEH